MKNLETLIQELCPDGVEFLKLGDVGTFYGGLSGKSKADFTDGNAKLVTYMNVYSNPALNTDIKDFVKIEEGEKQNKVLYGDILFTGSSETPNECGMTSVLTEKTEEDFYLNSFCFGYRFNDIDDVNPGFMKHLFRSHMLRKALAKTASGVTRFNVSKKKVANIEIPLPPIEVQTEIVRILDKFTSLETELEAELEAELVCRKRQYEYYRDKLLSFDNVRGQEVEWKKIGEICDTLSGFPFDSSKFQTSGIKLMRGKNVKRGYFDFNEDDDRYWESPDGLEKYLLQDKDIIISMDGSLVGKSFAMLSKKHLPLLLVQRVARVRAKSVNQNYLFHNIAHRFSSYVDKKKTGGAIPHVSMKDIQNFSIPVPSLQEQERIATILDRFESLTTSLQTGLPAEITARRQQYEHYRDKLLTFKRKGAA